jgi:hypothetical protein
MTWSLALGLAREARQVRKLRKQALRWSLILMAILLLAACADAGDGTSEGDSSLGEALPEDFLTNPLGDVGQKFDSVGAANLPFRPVVPTGLQGEVAFYAYVPDDAPDAAEAAWTFDDPSFGSFVVLEHPDDTTEQSLQVEVEVAPSPGCEERTVTDDKGQDAVLTTCSDYTASLAKLAGGQEALVIDAATASSVTWVEGLDLAGEGNITQKNLLIQVIGPATTLTPDQALEAANSITASPK